MNSDLEPIILAISEEESTADVYSRMKRAFKFYFDNTRNINHLIREAIECAMVLEYRLLKLDEPWLSRESYRATRNAETIRVLQSKAIEYAKPGADPEARYNNFIKAAKLVDSRAHICLCYFQLKHLASIDDLVTDTEAEKKKYANRWEDIVKEKFGDFINYGVLLIGMHTDPLNPPKED